MDDMASSACNVDKPSNFISHEPPPLQSLCSSRKRSSPITMANSPPVTHATPRASQTLTPPLTPSRPPYRRASASADALSLSSTSLYDVPDRRPRITKMDTEQSQQAQNGQGKEPSWEETTPRPPTKMYQLIDSTSGYEEYGRGVWSIVYRALECSKPETPPPAFLTPPTSPIITSTPPDNVQSVLAIKAPSRRDAHKVLDFEARILTYLHASPVAKNHLVPFHGYDGPAHCILMSPVPLSLESRAKTAAETARANFSTRTMFDPVIGTSQWAHLATHLIDGLNFLHSKSCIHGDIKPANILLQPSPNPDSPDAYTPLYADFSSSSVTSSITSPEQVSAITAAYASPELLLSLSNGQAFITPASDIYALAVTLIISATGESPFAGAKMEVQKLSMCREGKPLEFARNGEQGSRILKNREVSKALEGAVKGSETRWTVAEWKEEAGKALNGWMWPANTLSNL